jgi:hypothetical protein
MRVFTATIFIDARPDASSKSTVTHLRELQKSSASDVDHVGQLAVGVHDVHRVGLDAI